MTSLQQDLNQKTKPGLNQGKPDHRLRTVAQEALSTLYMHSVYLLTIKVGLAG